MRTSCTLPVSTLLGLPMRMCSRSVVFVPTGKKNEQYVTLKTNEQISKLADDDTNVVNPTALISKYETRPHDLAGLCLTDFASMYDQSIGYTPCPQDHENADDALRDDHFIHNEHEKTISNVKTIIGPDTSPAQRYYHIRKHPHIIRSVRFNKNKDPNNYYREQLMLYIPWDNEDITFPEINNFGEVRFPYKLRRNTKKGPQKGKLCQERITYNEI